MKAFFSKIVPYAEILLQMCLLPLFYVKFFHEVAILPGYTENGEFITKRVDHYYSMVDNLQHIAIPWIYISIGFLLASIAVTVLSLIWKRRKALQTTSHILFACSSVLFLLVLFIASTVQRCY